MTHETLIVALAALVATAALVPVCIVVAHRWGILDRPGALKSQESPVPYLGGAAVFAGVMRRRVRRAPRGAGPAGGRPGVGGG